MILSSTFDPRGMFQLNLKGAWPGYMICICDGGADRAGGCQDLLGVLRAVCCGRASASGVSLSQQQPARLSLRQ